MKWHDRFKSRFQELKVTKGMTQYTLADDLGVSQGTVANWLNGIREPRSIQDFEKIASVLGVTTDWLINGDSNHPSNPIQSWISSQSGIPLLLEPEITSWVSSGYSAEDLNPISIYDRSIVPESSRGTYAFKMRDSGMEPRFFTGDIVFVDPEKAPKPGDQIAIDFNGTGRLSIGYLTCVGPKLQLKMASSNFDLPDDFQETIYRGFVVAVLMRTTS